MGTSKIEAKVRSCRMILEDIEIVWRMLDAERLSRSERRDIQEVLDDIKHTYKDMFDDLLTELR